MYGKHQTPLNELLSDREMTGKSLAHAIGATESKVSDWRNGRHITPKWTKRISDALSLTDAEMESLGWDMGETE